VEIDTTAQSSAEAIQRDGTRHFRGFPSVAPTASSKAERYMKSTTVVLGIQGIDGVESAPSGEL